HFETDEEDEGRGETDEVQGSRTAGAKTYRALRKRGKSKNGRDDAPQIVIGVRVKEVTVGEGERRRRYVLCHNPQEEARQGEHRARVLAELQAELESLRDPTCEGHSKRVCGLRASRRYGRYLKLTAKGALVIDEAKVKAAARLDGKFVVHSNDDTLCRRPGARLQAAATGGRSVADAQEWVALTPRFPLGRASHHAHVFITVLALLLERMAEAACADTWRNIRNDLKRIKLAQLLSPHGTVWQLTEPPTDALNHLKSLKIKNPPPLLQIA
ncbi:MAG: hypothetical protein ACREYE_10005, partial [Gammaproteobacteria bacterium]